MTDRQITHAPGCWGWGPKHYECALREIERLRTENERLRAERGALREALEDIRSRMRLDPFDRLAELDNIHQIADAALSKENSND